PTPNQPSPTCDRLTPMSQPPFQSIYAHGLARVSVCVPRLRVASPPFNAERHIALAREADADRSILALFPELGLAAYSNEDLFHQDALLDAAEEAIEAVLRASTEIAAVLVVGTPLRLEAKLFNCAIVIHHGRI